MAVFKFRNVNTGQATPIPPGVFTVGREDDAYVHVEDGSVSRRHAMVYNEDDGFFLEDVGSANGTAFKGAFLTGRVQLDLGDVVYIGSVPFRLDPEVPGEPSAAPSAGLRSVNRAYMRRDTEKIPAKGEAPRVIESISVERLSAPAVSHAADMEAGDLNAVTITEPETPAAVRVPAVRAGNRPLPKETPAPQPVLPVPTPQSHAQDRLQADTRASLRSRQQTQRLGTSAPVAEESFSEVATAPASGLSWGWAILLFLAGLGTGLLLGLYFARLFFEMGGKAAGLP